MFKKKYMPCNCCGYLTIDENGMYEICPVCFWEDDDTTSLDDESSVNHMTLRTARNNYLKYGACDLEFLNCVRKPKKNEMGE